MYNEYDEPNIIELDDPVPHGAIVVALVATLIIVSLIIAPFVITLPEADPRVAADEQASGTTINDPVCRPDINVPPVLDDVAGFALPSWMRMCDWFIDPGPQPVSVPEQ